MAREKEKMLELINVKKIYTTKAGDVAALDGVSIRFPEKGMVFVTGKSGSGKTTLLNIIGVYNDNYLRLIPKRQKHLEL